MSNSQQILENLLPRLNSLIDSELRIKGSSKFIDSNYICGYDSYTEISLNVKILNDDFYFKIEYLGHSILQRTCKPTEETLNNFLYILEDLIQSSTRLKRQSQSFPNLTDEDNRDVKLKKLFEKNSYIPLVP
jgi:hypothetical protein